jgi:hypothetical protein
LVLSFSRWSALASDGRAENLKADAPDAIYTATSGDTQMGHFEIAFLKAPWAGPSSGK